MGMLRIIALLAVIVPLYGASQATIINNLPLHIKHTRWMTQGELAQLYTGKTWLWGNGGAYYGADRQYRAVADDEYAAGTWTVPGRGLICVNAFWHSEKSPVLYEKCTRHRIDKDNRIFQQTDDGDWYIYRNQPQQNDDAITELVSGNQIADDYKSKSKF